MPPRQWLWLLLRLAAARITGGAVAPAIENSGHDFALLRWLDAPPLHAPVVAYRVFSSRWALSYLKYHAPDLTGSYVLNGERLDVCTRPDGALGTWRLMALMHSEAGLFNGVAMATWSLADGGYAGGMLFRCYTSLGIPRAAPPCPAAPTLATLHSVRTLHPLTVLRPMPNTKCPMCPMPNAQCAQCPMPPYRMLRSNTSGASGERLLFPHRDGDLRLLGSAYDLKATYDFGVRPVPPLSTEDFIRVGESEAACPLLALAPPAALAQRGAPDISGHYFSVFNESLAVCTTNGTLVAAFSGLSAMHGLAFGAWNEGAARWEGLVADAGDNSGGGTAPFYWVAGPGGGLSGEWTVYNRTWLGYEIVDNITVIPQWQAHRSEGTEAEADAMGFNLRSYAFTYPTDLVSLYLNILLPTILLS